MKLLAVDLAGMLIFGGFMPPEAQEDPEGYDNYRTMEKVGYLTDLINSRLDATAPRSGEGAAGARKQDDKTSSVDPIFPLRGPSSGSTATD